MSISNEITVKYLLFYVLLFISSCSIAKEPLRIGVITDTHYLSEQLMEEGQALNDYIASSGKNIKDVPQVLDQVLNEYLNSDIQILLICGDITKDGEKLSHLDFLKKLKPLQDKGVKIYVIPGNHDVNMPNASEYKGDKKLPVANISPDDFASIYKDCGYGSALKRDNNSLSYVASLDDQTWLLAIDAARYREYTTGSITAGKISPDSEKWILEILREAKQKNKQVIGMMHWGFAEHIMYQSSFFKDYLVEDYLRLANLFADNGIKAIFTGHFHSNDITAFTSDKGNVIYDIETGTLSAYPFSYRFVELDANGMKIKTENVTSIPGNPYLAEEDKQRMLKLSTTIAKGKINKLGYNLSEETYDLFADIIGQIFIKHAYGDEKVDKSLKESLEKLSETMDIPMNTNEIELDFPPEDNNLYIKF